jgi:hypothetical protein
VLQRIERGREEGGLAGQRREDQLQLPGNAIRWPRPAPHQSPGIPNGAIRSDV